MLRFPKKRCQKYQKNAKYAKHFRNANPWLQSRRHILSQRPGHKKRGGRRWQCSPPPGAFNPPATEGVPSACWDWHQIRYQIHPDLSQMANLKSQTLYARQRSYTPLFVSPQEPGDHRSPAQNFRFLCLVGSCWSIFSPSETCMKKDIDKTLKKTRKSRILASQNPPKISPKCLQNRCPTKPAISLLFLAYSDCFRLRALFLRSA